MSDPTFLDPVGPVRELRIPRAPRLDSLDGAAIGILENSKPNAGALLESAAEWMGEKFGTTLVQHFTKPGPASPAQIGWYETLSNEVKAVLTGSGD